MPSGFAQLHRRAARATARASLGAGLFVFVILSLPIAFGYYYYGLDLTRIDLGILCAFDRQLADGSGLWLSSTLGNGAAFFARPEVGLFYPPRWVALLLPPDLGTSWGPIFHLSFAAGATGWLARTFGVRPLYAAAAGVLFALSGTALDLILHSHYIVAAAWLPLSWAAARRFLSVRGRASHGAILGGALALCLLGGEPQAFAIASAVAAIEVILRLARWRRRALIAALRVSVIILAAFAVGMAQWATTLAELSITGRQAALDASQAMLWPFLPVTWPAVLWPGFVDEPVWPAADMWSMWNGALGPAYPWNRQPYVGSLFVACTTAGIFLRRARWPALLMLAAVVLALGDQLPVLPALTELLPPLRLFRYPAKLLVLATLAATLVVALAAQSLTRARIVRRHLLWAGGALALGNLVAFFMVTAHAGTLDGIAAGMRTSVALDDLPLASTMLRFAILHSLAPLLAALAIVAWVPRWRHTLVVLMVADLVLAMPTHIMAGPALEDLRSPASRLASPEVVLCTDPNLRNSAFLPASYSRWGAYAALRGVPFPELNACDGLASTVPYSPLMTTMTDRLVRGLTHYRAAAARGLGCTHLVSRVPPREGTVTLLSDADPSWHMYQEAYRSGLYAIDDPVPRVFIAREPRWVVGHEEKLVNALSATRDAAGTVAIIDDPTDTVTGELPDGLGVTGIDVDWPVRHEATVSARGTGGAVLGLRTAFQVGWSARQGGERLPVVRVAGQVLGAVVSDVGRGPIRFVYAPPDLGLGLALALAGVLVIAGIALWRRPFLAKPNGIGHDRPG